MPFSLTAHPMPGPAPVPPPANVTRVDVDGKPTPAVVQYEQKLQVWQTKMNAWLALLAASVP